MILSFEEYKILAHTLGIELEYRTAPLSYNRNYFSACDTHQDIQTLSLLEEKNLMFRYEKFGGQVFSVTDKGKKIFEEYFSQYFMPDNSPRKVSAESKLSIMVDCPYCMENNDVVDNTDLRECLGYSLSGEEFEVEHTCKKCDELFIITDVSY